MSPFFFLVAPHRLGDEADVLALVLDGARGRGPLAAGGVVEGQGAPGVALEGELGVRPLVAFAVAQVEVAGGPAVPDPETLGRRGEGGRGGEGDGDE